MIILPTLKLRRFVLHTKNEQSGLEVYRLRGVGFRAGVWKFRCRARV